jgi:hypothetical protein
MAAAALMCSTSAVAQNRVKSMYTETQTLKVEQVMNAEQTVQLNRYLMAGYNTLCLPMTMNAEQLQAAAKGVKVERMVAIRQEGSSLCLYFTDCTNEGIEAGVPYLIFSPTAQYLRARNTEADAIDTELKTIRMNDSQGNQVAFGSSWEMRTKEGMFGIPAKQNVPVLESVLISTTADQSFLPTRCGFSWEQKSSSASELIIKHVSDSEATAISTVRVNDSRSNDAVYDLNGRRTTSNKKGLYIQGGKKVIR